MVGVYSIVARYSCVDNKLMTASIETVIAEFRRIVSTAERRNGVYPLVSASLSRILVPGDLNSSKLVN